MSLKKVNNENDVEGSNLKEKLQEFTTIADWNKSEEFLTEVRSKKNLLLDSFDLLEQYENSEEQKTLLKIIKTTLKQTLQLEDVFELLTNFFPSLIWCHYQKSLSSKFPWLNEEVDENYCNLVEELLLDIFNNLKIYQRVKQHASYAFPIEPYPIFDNDIDEIYKVFKIPLDLPVNNIEQIFTTNYQELVLNSPSMDIGTYSNDFSQLTFPLQNFVYSKRMLMYSFFITFFYINIDKLEKSSLKRLMKIVSLFCRVGYDGTQFFKNKNCNLTINDLAGLEQNDLPRAQISNHFVCKISVILFHLLYKIPYEVFACITDLKELCEIRLLSASLLSIESILTYVNSMENAFLKYSQYSFTVSFTDINTNTESALNK